MKKNIITAILAAGGLFAMAQSTPYVVPNRDWVQFYQHAAYVQNAPTTIDANNNMYLTGYTSSGTNTSTYDILTMKRDSLGNLIFNNAYDNGGYDVGAAIRLSGTDFFVAGTSFDTPTNNDYIVIKYNNIGTQVWTYRYNNTGDIDEASDIAVDVSGNSYITGRSKNMNGDFDIVTIKLNSSGSLQWTHTYNGASGQDDEGKKLVMIGNDVYVTGSTTDATNGKDILVYKLNGSNGSIQWSTIYNGTANGNDVPFGMTKSGADVLVCGQLDNTGTGMDAAILRIDGGTGSSVYTQTYDFGNSANLATDLVRDSTGNVAVVGTAINSSVYEYHTLLFDSTGTQLWVNVESTGLYSLAANPHIACDTIANHFYVCGEKQRATKDMFVYQLTPTGNTSWRVYQDGNASDIDASTGLAVNGVGVVYVGGMCKNSSALYDYTCLKINQTPVYFPLDLGTPESPNRQFTFEQNKGQVLQTDGVAVNETSVAFFNNSTSPSHYISANRISFLLCNSNPALDDLPDSLQRVDMSIVGANSLAEFFSYDAKDYSNNYFIGSNTNGISATNYQRLFVPNLYPYTDMHYYSNSQGLKTYFVFKKPEIYNIPQFEFSGADSTIVDGSGDLIVYTRLGDFNIGRVTAYQVAYNFITMTYTLAPVTANWQVLGSNLYGFNVPSFTSNLPLVVYVSKPAAGGGSYGPIDNVSWSTFIGGQGKEDMLGSAVDTRNNYYTCGYSAAINFPYVAGSYQSAPSGSNSAAVYYGTLSKFRPDRKLLFSTYFRSQSQANNGCGSTPDTKLFDVAVDSLFNVYCVGSTNSNNMPIVPVTASGGLNQTSNGATGPSDCGNAIIFKLNPTGSGLRYSSYYGGNGGEYLEVAKYHNGQVWFGGRSRSSNLALVNSGGGVYSAGDGFFMRVDTQGVVKHCTKTGTEVKGGAVDNNGNWYIFGFTGATYGVNVLSPAPSFYTANAQSSIDWTLQRFAPGDFLNWSTYIGGNSNDYASNMTIRDTVMVLCGYGTSSVFPFVKASTDSGDVNTVASDEIQLMKFNTKTGQRLWSAYHATPNSEQAFDVAIDPNYNLFVTGYVQCYLIGSNTSCPGSNFKLTPTSGYYQQPNKIGWDGFMLGYSSDNKRKWTTYLGSSLPSQGIATGSNDEWGYALEANNFGNVFVTGFTRSKSNSYPLVRYNNVCHFDSAVADVSGSLADGIITMFSVSNFSVVGIKDYGSIKVSENITLFPNPNNGIFTVRIKESHNTGATMIITNLLGQVIYQKSGNLIREGDYEIDSGQLPKGVYFLTLGEGNKQQTIKFIVN